MCFSLATDLQMNIILQLMVHFYLSFALIYQYLFRTYHVHNSSRPLWNLLEKPVLPHFRLAGVPYFVTFTKKTYLKCFNINQFVQKILFCCFFQPEIVQQKGLHFTMTITEGIILTWQGNFTVFINKIYSTKFALVVFDPFP